MYTRELLNYIENSPTAYQAVDAAAKILEEQGFIRLGAKDAWELASGKGYYTVQNGTSIIAFCMPEKQIDGIMLAASHSDSPTFKLKAVCEADTGEYIIVEMQNREQTFFKDRALYYMAQSVVKQSKKGRGWQFSLTAVYGVYFVNFMIDRNDPTEHFCKDIAMIDKRTGKVFNNKFRQIYIELPRFMKPEADCDNFLEYWIYNLVNMDKLKEISFKDKKAIFDRLERIASQANLSKDERARLDEDWKNYNDFFNTMDYAKEEGRAEQNLENARNFKALGVSTEIIMKATGLTEEEIEKL